MSDFERTVLEKLEKLDKQYETLNDTINKRIDKLDKKFDEKYACLDKKFDEKYESLHNSIILLENKVLSEFPALYEAFELNRQLQEDRDEKITYLSAKVEENSIRITALEDKMKVI